jgi:hypothetical protein
MRALSNSAIAPSMLRSRVDMGEFSPVNTSASFTNSTRTPWTLHIFSASFIGEDAIELDSFKLATYILFDCADAHMLDSLSGHDSLLKWKERVYCLLSKTSTK